MWALDTHTRELTQVPGMPALVSLKSSSMEWTRDGRLVFLIEWERKSFVAVWRPGEKQLRVKRVQLPPRSGGSDGFAVLP